MTDKYNDIINMPHHVSPRHKHMSLYDRAAQFAPFAALTGYEESISATLEQTTKEIASEKQDYSTLTQAPKSNLQ